MRLWYPSLQEVKEVFRCLGAYNPALYPHGPFQHSSRALESEASLGCWEPQDPPQEVALDIKLSYIYRFLILCFLVQPTSYTDASILGLMELLCRAGLDVGLRLLPKTDLQQLLLLLLENIQEWPGKLQPLCCALSWVSDHHHNLLTLVQFFLDATPRGRQLRSQLSLMVIARMLGQQESLPLWGEKTQLALLSQLLSLMRPSSLRQCLGSETLPCTGPNSRTWLPRLTSAGRTCWPTVSPRASTSALGKTFKETRDKWPKALEENCRRRRVEPESAWPAGKLDYCHYPAQGPCVPDHPAHELPPLRAQLSFLSRALSVGYSLSHTLLSLPILNMMFICTN
ncbi:rCG22208, isoform CRA_a [Rattus norvegicus]|uniref:RCG22208, isoform CRA_a n=1 Tax=Rattus norvegicus TaxID=10116 RepID=A6INE3_RAT|nr:rCG22208, isoform CRA_a [Rattus norvegicus]